MNNRKIIVYIAASLDGYIAGPGDDLSFLSIVTEEGEDYGYADFILGIDTVIMGRKTYDWVMTQVPEFPHAGMETYIITSTARPPEGNTVFYTGDLNELVLALKARPGKNIFVDGGAAVVNALLKEKFVDELYISFVPVLLGDGLPLFNHGRPEQTLQLLETKQFKKGLVQVHYQLTGG